MNQKRGILLKAPNVIPQEHTVPTSLMLTAMSDEERRAHVWEKRLRGYSYESIYREMKEEFDLDVLPKGWSVKTVYADCAAILAQVQNEYRETAIEAANIELSRFDVLLDAVWENAKAGDIRSVDAALAISRERRKLLGLDDPTRIQVDWTVQVADLLQKGVITPREVAEEFGEEGLITVNQRLLEMKAE